MYYCSSCPAKFKKNGTCLKKHEEKCGLKNAFDFTDSFFVSDTDTSTSSEDISLLDTGFIGKTSNVTGLESEVSSFLLGHSGSLSVGLFNINSIHSKRHEIDFLLDNQLVDILVLNETRLDEGEDMKEYLKQHYKLEYRHRPRANKREKQTRGCNGGGIMIYVKKNIQIYSSVTDVNAEIIAMKLILSNQTKIGLIGSYRPESIDSTVFFSALEEKTLSLIDEVDNIIIAGDLNYDLLKSQQNKLVDFNKSMGFGNTIATGTRLNKTTGYFSLLDVILTLCATSCIISAVFPISFSDHSLVFSIFNYKSFKRGSETIMSRCLNAKKLSQIAEEIRNFPFHSLDFSTCIDEKWFFFKNSIISILDEIAPYKKFKVKPNNKPWMDLELVSLMKKREYYHNKFVKSKSDSHKASFTKFRNKFKSLYRRKEVEYYNKLESEQGKSPKYAWNQLQPILNPNKTSEINKLVHKGVTFNTTVEIVGLFYSIFMNLLADFIFLPLSDCLDYTNHLFTNNPAYSSRTCCSNLFKFRELNRMQVLKALQCVDISSSSGSHGIPTKLLKACADELASPICSLFNQCIRSNKFPSDFKQALVTPIYKGKGSKNDPDNYRPISVLPPLAKIFERALAEQMTEHMEASYLFHPSQYGFRKGLSCELALNEIIDYWRESLNDKKVVASILLDLKKAFDTVDHLLVVNKLKYYNFDHQAIKMLDSYLANRSYSIFMGGIKSESIPLNIGVPQGSVMGPLLFIIYINDIFKLKTSSQLVLFADDTTISFASIDMSSLKTTMETDLDLLDNWLKHNRLTVNWAKTNYMCLGTKFNEEISLQFGNQQLTRVKQARLLGVTLDDELKLDKHIDLVCSKANRKAYLIGRKLYLFSSKFRTTLFKLFILPNLEYCSSLFIKSSQHNIDQLERCFRKNLKVFTRLSIPKGDQMEQYTLLKSANLLPLQMRLLEHFIMLIHSLLRNHKAVNIIAKLQKQRLQDLVQFISHQDAKRTTERSQRAKQKPNNFASE
jgi:hypothetical protein